MSFLKDWAKATFRAWPNKHQRVRLAGEYAALRTSELALADLCIRNCVFSPMPNVTNLFDAGVAEGRRRAVLELLLLVRVNPQALAELPRAQSVEEDRYAA